jgi:hypothetical protein
MHKYITNYKTLSKYNLPLLTVSYTPLMDEGFPIYIQIEEIINKIKKTKIIGSRYR